ncbi:MAG: hypothetical protein M1548_05505, partial [Actinobacteria bacterium]|nr:hypothetical protein [Actinomycetota bacterium]
MFSPFVNELVRMIADDMKAEHFARIVRGDDLNETLAFAIRKRPPETGEGAFLRRVIEALLSR